MGLPEKDSLLNAQHYEEIAERVYNDESPKSALIFFERQYSAVNVEFSQLLLKAIQSKITAEYRTLNGLLLANPGTPFEEAKSWLPRLAGFQNLKEMVTEYFATKGTAPQSFGEQLAEVVRAALAERELLDDKGHFSGDYTQVKALYVVLRERRYLPKKSKNRAAELLAALFASKFNFPFTPRAITRAEEEPNIGQDREERRFKGVIPERE